MFWWGRGRVPDAFLRWNLGAISIFLNVAINVKDVNAAVEISKHLYNQLVVIVRPDVFKTFSN
ncbi:hypothetical protein TI04_11380 [Achromatium sp. WMS2]|nr:hypothetical protein TI04_11380 [Achromatium sp. WMS2]